jgi:hypothetical protein
MDWHKAKTGLGYKGGEEPLVTPSYLTPIAIPLTPTP